MWREEKNENSRYFVRQNTWLNFPIDFPFLFCFIFPSFSRRKSHSTSACFPFLSHLNYELPNLSFSQLKGKWNMDEAQNRRLRLEKKVYKNQ